ncbi:hypothetical protein GCM10010329_50150 [Streptomyces spiroverticillatus]|uniref:Phage tail protein n=1 Tax=Streptomyces finlayi TaxID=67296 RepID=A0A918X1D9_9ACTN|nr:hypothetical protein [Streptomyces finlayi]GHA20726.1 hypothetical protein GCM10010329_50150 [Streptomyces spiroverticillatus]GHD03394.1 hypothetical protein GCM10010334_51100 [Streptomyces finlayi]
MSVTESKLKEGALTFGPDGEEALKVSCQTTAVTLEPSFDEAGDPVEVLCGDTLAAATKTTWAMKFTGIQDFTDPKGFQMYAFEHDGETVEFTWKPNKTGPTFTGRVTVKALAFGGDVNTRIDVEAEWPCNGKPTVTPAETPAPEQAAPALVKGK